MKININFINGAFCEILDNNNKNKYYVQFINKETNEILHDDVITSNKGCLITGIAGTGKTYFANLLVSELEKKGKVVGNCGSHKDQALVLVNYGNASGDEIYQLALAIQPSVMDKFQVKIIPEVNIV